MSGGSADDACLAVAHYDKARKVTVLDSLMSQAGGCPFNPRDAVRKFAAELREYGLSKVTGDTYAGQTFAKTSRPRTSPTSSIRTRHRKITRPSSRG